ncbi:hypothetical protein CDAR_71851 [Caerostris darwini]|uniref:Uncharacterized protein n=1 Tax=Caerostris darwini TaxID=1538125 RepID=A0AAV4TIA8_9ARAC|nr:hypothetical protein CDAR_71851 [Caerostris darwini]
MLKVRCKLFKFCKIYQIYDTLIEMQDFEANEEEEHDYRCAEYHKDSNCMLYNSMILIEYIQHFLLAIFNLSYFSITYSSEEKTEKLLFEGLPETKSLGKNDEFSK